MIHLEKKYHSLAKAVERAGKEFEKFKQNNKAAGVRLRKDLQEIKVLAQEMKMGSLEEAKKF